MSTLVTINAAVEQIYKAFIFRKNLCNTHKATTKTKEIMAQIDNLNQKNLDGLKNFVENMQSHSPEVAMRTYSMAEKPVDVKELTDKIDALSRKIDLIFGECFENRLAAKAVDAKSELVIVKGI